MGCAIHMPRPYLPSQLQPRALGVYAANIQQAREGRGRTEAEAATFLGLTVAEYRAIERGEADLPADSLQHMAEWVGGPGAEIEEQTFGFPVAFFRQQPHQSLGPIWMQGDGIEACACGEAADYLCDFPLGKGKTCDAPLCWKCRRQQGGETMDLDFCPAHALIAFGMVTE
jgi:transcriptional regulator with XRE-family HTH domain